MSNFVSHWLGSFMLPKHERWIKNLDATSVLLPTVLVGDAGQTRTILLAILMVKWVTWIQAIGIGLLQIFLVAVINARLLWHVNFTELICREIAIPRSSVVLYLALSFHELLLFKFILAHIKTRCWIEWLTIKTYVCWTSLQDTFCVRDSIDGFYDWTDRFWFCI